MDEVLQIEKSIQLGLENDAILRLNSLKKSIASLGIRSHAPSGHFYSPVVDPNNLSSYYIDNWQKRSNKYAIPSIDVDRMVDLWNAMVPNIERHHFNKIESPGARFYLDNNYFGISDAAVFVGILNYFKPSRYYEIGSGFSSALALDVAENASWPMQLQFVEPFPHVRLDSLLTFADRERTVIEKAFAQDIPVDWFLSLEKNDILFIDSTHIAKSGSDVLYLYFEILPKLRNGVIIHVHDIFFPFEYPPHWVVDQNRSWNEAYILRALLEGSQDFEIIFFNDAFGLHHKALIKDTYPAFLGAGQLTGGSIWLRKKD